MSEVTQQEYRAKERERDRYLQEQRSCEKKISSLGDEIAELDRAINHMTQVYQDFKRQANEMNDALKEKREFIGNQKKQLIDSDGNNLISKSRDAQQQVNSVLDQLEWLRNEKRKQRNNQYGILGRIQSHLSTIRTWLKTRYFNN